MPKSNVTWLRPPGPTVYTDAAALNDIHALLTSATGEGAPGVLADIGLILARSGRPTGPRPAYRGPRHRDRPGVAGRARRRRGHHGDRGPGPGGRQLADRDHHHQRPARTTARPSP